jgi:hypothetical protein
MRKNKMFLCGITLACTLISGACLSGEYKGLGESLTLSGQAYTRDINSLNFSVNYVEYMGNLDVSDGDIGGAGEIKNGKLSYSVKKPELFPIADGFAMLKRMYDGIKFSPEDAQAALLNLTVTGSSVYSLLSGETLKVTVPSLAYETVYYVYIDRDVVITAEANSFASTDFYIPISITTQKINLKLKKGWNALHGKTEAKLILFPSLQASGNLELSVGNPSSLKWTLGSPQNLPF